MLELGGNINGAAQVMEINNFASILFNRPRAGRSRLHSGRRVSTLLSEYADSL